MQVQVHVINPLAVSNNELYGSFDEGTHEWQDGVLARIMRTVCKDESPDQKWILFDGPVDTLWIESMNTLLDDNKLLTLLSGERISMSPQVSATCAWRSQYGRDCSLPLTSGNTAPTYLLPLVHSLRANLSRLTCIIWFRVFTCWHQRNVWHIWLNFCSLPSHCTSQLIKL